MRWCRFLLFLSLSISPLRAEIAKDAIALLYNSQIAESKALAEKYAALRGIPPENLIGLEMPTVADISREQYGQSIAAPLRTHFDRKGWWKRVRDSQGSTISARNSIHLLVIFKGVPLRITRSASASPDSSPPDAPTDPFKGHDEASVDSELAMFGLEGLPYEGPWQNKFFQSKVPFSQANLPFLVLTARIDAPSFATCRRMIQDAIDTETCGLWGMCYVDVANKFPLGDAWMKDIAAQSRNAGIPTVVDSFNETFPAGYPMARAATYFGWYEWNPSGPLIDPSFRFRKGAIAVHLHSFSAQQLTNAHQNWAAPLLERGAAATLGNVWEPYLHLTHHLALFHQNLLAGDTLVEAAWKSMPATSWQGVVLGDPLYRPFLHFNGSGEIDAADRDFRAIRAAQQRWPNDPAERRKNLAAAADRTRSGILAEALGLDYLATSATLEASSRFLSSKALYSDPGDLLRQDFHKIAIDREAGRKSLALRGLRDARMRYSSLAGLQGINAWIDLLDPPPAPPQKK